MENIDEASAAFRRMRHDLLQSHPGEYAVFVGENFVGTAPDLDGAIDLGWAKAGGPDFLPARIVEEAPLLLPAALVFAR